MYLVDGDGRICADHGLYHGDGVFHHGNVVIPWVLRTSFRPRSWNLLFIPAGITVWWWWLHGISVLILAVCGMQ